MYFYPWGSRELDNLIPYQIDQTMIDGTNGIPDENRFDFRKYNLSLPETNYALCGWTQQDLICHDQEPLNFSLYDKNSPLVKNYNKLKYKFDHFNLKIPHSTIYKKSILLHSELNSNQLKKYEDTGLFVGAFWCSHAVIARDWYRYAEHDQRLSKSLPRQKIFLSYCRRIDDTSFYRKTFINKINNLDLEKECLISSTSNKRSDLSGEYHADDFVNTAISIVLETTFDERIHVTEKTFRPIACGHPFIILNGPGCLEFLKKYGFKTFHPYINESYDTVQDHTRRLDYVVAEMKRIVELNDEDFNRLLVECRSIAQHNKKLFFSNEFLEKITSELKQNVDFAFKQSVDNYSVDIWMTMLKVRREERKQKIPVKNDAQKLTMLRLIRKLKNKI